MEMLYQIHSTVLGIEQSELPGPCHVLWQVPQTAFSNGPNDDKVIKAHHPDLTFCLLLRAYQPFQGHRSERWSAPTCKSGACGYQRT